MAGLISSNQKAGKGLIAALTGFFGLYLTAAMWLEFNEALGFYFGPSMGIIIGTIVFLLYQDRKNIREFSAGQAYNTSESTMLVKGPDGRYTHAESNIESGRNPVLFIALLYFTIIVISEIAWSDLFF
tara:strand:- start:803 stop:1186 length:384 start_codon:yes stop_codon:yes gene_type:complete